VAIDILLVRPTLRLDYGRVNLSINVLSPG
jgi:hypothetical protein